MRTMTTLYLILIPVYLVLAENQGSTNADLYLKNYNNLPNSRIIGGKEVEPHSIPYQVALFITVPGQEKKMFCGGSLLNNVFVLTAAHCIDGATEAEVIVGAHNVYKEELSQKRYVSKIFIIHKQWNPYLLINDIAIVRLPRSVEFSDEIQPIRLPEWSDKYKTFSFKRATVSGWGITSDDATEISPVLRSAQTRVTPPFICKLFFFGRPGPNHICVDGYRGKSVCSGDSGGPIVIYNRDGEPVQQGIVSYGIGFGCEKGWPQVSTKVSRYLKWIYEHTGIKI